MRVWVICPNLWGARLFQYGISEEEEGRNRLRFAREYPRPKIQTRHEDLPEDDDDQPAEGETEVAEKFMTQIAVSLERAALIRDFDSIILCAEPHLLHMLESKLQPETRKRVIGKVEIDLYEANESDLLPYVRDFLPDKGKEEAA